MSVRLRGFNFIYDYGTCLARTSSKKLSVRLDIIRSFHKDCERYAESFDNMEEEMKRFISWLHWTYTQEQYDYFMENDDTGFLKNA